MVWFVAIVVLVLVIAWLWWRLRQMARADYIRQFPLPNGLLDKLANHYPQLQPKDRQLIARAMRQFFLTYLKSGRNPVAMPSQAVDALWHEFNLYTRHYQHFCKKAFGHFLHHTPAVVLSNDRDNNLALRRTWWYACLDENINPRKATRLPLLFAIDYKLNITNGFHYNLNCQRQDQQAGDGTSAHCAGDFSDSSSDGYFGGDFASDGGCSADSGGCGGGCGGD